MLRYNGFAAVKLLIWLAGLAVLAGVVVALTSPPQFTLAELQEKYATPESRFADIDGVRMHYMDQGSGPVIVLLHASFMNLRSWDAVAETLSSRYRVIRPDFLTAGLTGPEPNDEYTFDRNLELVQQLLRSLDVDRYALVGTSSGGIVAFNYAARFPDNVSRLILINSAGMPRNAKTNPNRVRGTWLSRWLDTRFPTRDKMRDILDINFIEPHEPPDWLVDMNFDMSRREGLQRAGAIMMAKFRTGDPQQVLAEITMPTLIMWGLDNQTVFHLEAEVFAHWLTGAASMVKKYPGLGHYAYVEEPAQIAGDIEKFLSGELDVQLIRHRRSQAPSPARQITNAKN
ncbi:MAG: alpha/beta hydrolase [Gammaproteobacteria bacterium]|nr:alpha/beta hydrolase [Gammaproteobacteria bacterium]NND53863.1 alpha/beta hydrolase [Gammaproteobacteria bacterium]